MYKVMVTFQRTNVLTCFYLENFNDCSWIKHCASCCKETSTVRESELKTTKSFGLPFPKEFSRSLAWFIFRSFPSYVSKSFLWISVFAKSRFLNNLVLFSLIYKKDFQSKLSLPRISRVVIQLYTVYKLFIIVLCSWFLWKIDVNFKVRWVLRFPRKRKLE